jgi:hypothetical protein
MLVEKKRVALGRVPYRLVFSQRDSEMKVERKKAAGE